MKTLSICIPTYNERKNIGILTEKIIKILKDTPIKYEIIIIDDNSPDGTGKIIDYLATKYNNVIPIHRSEKNGLAQAYKEGFKNSKGELIMTMDADLSHDPISIPNFIKAAKCYDVVVGSRFMKGGGNFNRSTLRIMISKFTTILANMFLKIKISDSTTGYRLYHRPVLEKVLPYVKSQRFPFLVEILEKSKYFNFTCGAVPIKFYERKFGESKFNAMQIIDFFAIIIQKRPLLKHLLRIKKLVNLIKRLVKYE